MWGNSNEAAEKRKNKEKNEHKGDKVEEEREDARKPPGKCPPLLSPAPAADLVPQSRHISFRAQMWLWNSSQDGALGNHCPVHPLTCS